MKLDPRKPDNPHRLVVSRRADRQCGLRRACGRRPRVHDDLVVTTTNYGQVIGLDRATGAVRWKFHLPGPVWQSPVIVDDTLAAGRLPGRAACLRREQHDGAAAGEVGAEHRRVHRVDTRRSGRAASTSAPGPAASMRLATPDLSSTRSAAVASLRRGTGEVHPVGERVGWPMTTFDLIVRNGSVVDGTGSSIGAGRRRRRSAIECRRSVTCTASEQPSRSTPTDRIVTPGFVDIHTHLDAQLAWDPIGTSSCWHGVTSVVMGNCGVTFAPVQPDDREYLAEMMESVEDIPADVHPRRPAVGLEDLRRVPRRRRPHAQGHERRRHGRPLRGALPRHGRAQPRRGARDRPTTSRRCASSSTRRCAAGALGFSTVAHASPPRARRSPRARHVRRARRAARHRRRARPARARRVRGCGSARRGRRRLAHQHARPRSRWMSELSRRIGPSGHVRARAVGSPARPVRTRHPAHRGGQPHRRRECDRRRRRVASASLFGLANNTPYRPMRRRGARCATLPLADRLAAMRDPVGARALIAEADGERRIDARARHVFVLAGPDARYDCTADDSLAAHAARRGVERRSRRSSTSRSRPTARRAVNFPFLNQSLDAVAEMLADPTVVHGPRRRRRPRRPDHGREPAHVLPHVLGARAGRLLDRGGRPPAHLRHRRPVRRRPTAACSRPARSPTST